ncbi:AraC family transcriptional regulator [Cellvibrio sp.]|uniref:AraC family transcriptional regulator n=1 Tax=Cellvibrio sp. TaxID=1965322 RepID=UPI0039648C84
MFNQSVKLPLLGFFFSLCLGNSVNAQTPDPVSAPKPATAESVQQPAVTPQVENLKVSVLNLNRDLLILEEELLYPPSNQVAVYLSMNIGQFFNLDAVKLEIDNKLVASELYTDKQINALYRGGVQRLYIGNLKAGEHEIAAFFTGRGPQQDYKRGAKLVVNKTQAPLVLELKIIDSTAQLQPNFEIKEWKAEE